MTDTWPVAVMGGGIAGAAAVLTLAEREIKPLWIAPEPAAGDRVGESLAPAANRTLSALGAMDLLDGGRHRRSNATFSAWGGEPLVERNAITSLQGAGWVLDRAAFEQDLVARATAQVEPHRVAVAGADHAGEAWRLELDDGSAVNARYLLDGSGRSAVIGRRLSELRRTDQLMAAWSVFDQTADDVEPTRATLIEAVEDGWWYAALLPDGRLMVAWFTDPDLAPLGLTRDLATWRDKITEPPQIGHWIKDAGFTPAAPPTLASAGTTWLAPCAGPGWAAIGDAAAAFDPLSSHGMTTALWSGRAAAIAVADELGGQEGRLDAYASTVAGGVSEFLTQRARFYGAERRFAQAPFWARRQSEPVR